MGAVKLEELPHYTYDDYKMWEGDWELINGIAYAMAPAPMVKHQNLAMKIARYLDEEIDECQECFVAHEVDYRLSENTILRPDVVLVCGEENEEYLTKAPKIVVEVISKSTAKRDENQKFRLYEAEGVLYYILVYPNELIAKVYEWKDGRYIKKGDFNKEKCLFEIEECKVELDFERVFKRYRK